MRQRVAEVAADSCEDAAILSWSKVNTRKPGDDDEICRVVTGVLSWHDEPTSGSPRAAGDDQGVRRRVGVDESRFR